MVIWLGLKDLVGVGGMIANRGNCPNVLFEKIIDQGHGCPRRTIVHGRLLSNVIVDQGDICPKETFVQIQLSKVTILKGDFWSKEAVVK